MKFLLQILPISIFMFPALPLGATLPSSSVILNEVCPIGVLGILDEQDVGVPPSGEDREDKYDWIELKNVAEATVTLEGWSLTDNPSAIRKWVFPDVSIPPGGFLAVLASGEDRRPTDGRQLHTNFELDAEGEFVGLYDPEGVLQSQLAPNYPAARFPYSYGLDPVSGEFRFLNPPTPGAENTVPEAYSEFVEGPVEFSVSRGFYEEPFLLELSQLEVGVTIRFTTDSSAPTPFHGGIYNGPFTIDRSTVVRAVATHPAKGPSEIMTHTYFLNVPDNLRHLPALSIVSPEENFTGPNGIAHPANVQKRGNGFERPVSVEYIDPETPGFQINAGIRLHGQLGRSQVKKSYRLYFRSEYGASRLEFPLMPDSGVTSFKRIVLRAGVQDRNPFITDEMSRRIYGDLGQVASHGTFVQLFRNTSSSGYYNPTERYDRFFFQSWRGGSEEWDIIRHNGVADGDGAAWNELLNFVRNNDLSEDTNYQEVARRLDVVNFVDYLLLYLYGAGNDWPNNNWTAAREAVSGARFRFYPWDAEQMFGSGFTSPTRDTIANQLLAEAPDDQITPIPRLFRALIKNRNFRLLFAVRFRTHFFEGGGLVESNIMGRFLQYRAVMLDTLPTLTGTVPFLSIPGRRYNVEKMMDREGLLELVDLPLDPNLDPLTRLPEVQVEPSTGTADLNRDGRIDALDLQAFLENREAFNGKGEFRQVSLKDDRWERVDYALGRGVRGLVVADLDKDGDLDLATVNGDYGRLLSLGNLGKGVFGRPVISPAPLGAAALTGGDLNGDGLPDLVIASDFMLRYKAGTYLNQGNGTFQLAHETGFNAADRMKNLHPRTIRLGDLNGDGSPDLIVQNQTSIQEGGLPPTHYLSILQNLGSGEFVAAVELKCGSGTLTSSRALVVEDLDHNGSIDLVTSTGDRAPVLIKGLGGGGFAPAAKLDFLSFVNLWGVDTADIDLDGDLDLAVCDRVDSGGVHFYLNDGNGGFTGDPGRRNGGLTPETIHFTDIDSDGDPDLAVIHYWAIFDNLSRLQILLNDGAGRFEDTPPFFTADTAPFPKWIESGDFDSDGDTDLATLDEYNGTLTIFLSQRIPSFPSPDFNGDGNLDFEDLAELGADWMSPSSP